VDEMDVTCSMHWEMRNTNKILFENLNKRVLLGDLGVAGKVMLK
jgi:hypothetical protein